MTEQVLENNVPPPIIDKNYDLKVKQFNIPEELPEKKGTELLIQYSGVPPRIIQLAHAFGYIYYGWTLEDYIRHAINKKGYATILLWGEQGCLVGETLVLTPNGEVPIKNLRVDDNVIGVSPSGVSTTKVTNIFKFKRSLLRIKTNTREIYASPEHRFFTLHGWKRAIDLNRGDTLLRIDIIHDKKEGDERFEVKTLDRRGYINFKEDDNRRGKDNKRSCLYTEQIGKSSNANEGKNRIEGKDMEIYIPTPRTDMEERTNERRIVLFGWYNRWRGDYNDYNTTCKIPKFKANIDYLEYIKRINELVDGFIQCSTTPRFEKIWWDINANSSSQLGFSRNLEESVSIFDNKKKASPIINQVCRNKVEPKEIRTLYQRMYENVLGNTQIEFDEYREETEEVLAVSSFSKEEGLYDITTTAGNYIANNIVVHNSGKSNLTLQMGYWVYDDWDLVLKNIVSRPADFVKTLKAIRKGKRRPWIGWDDIGVHYTSSAFKLHADQYEAIDSVWASIRTKCTCVTLNIPLINRLARNLKDNVTFEVLIGPNQMIQIERYVRLVGLKDIEATFKKIQIERLHKFDMMAVPQDVFKQYYEQRLTLTEEAIQKLGNTVTEDEIEDYMPILEVSEQTGYSIRTLLDMSTNGALPHKKINETYMIRKDGVEHLMKNKNKRGKRSEEEWKEYIENKSDYLAYKELKKKQEEQPTEG